MSRIAVVLGAGFCLESPTSFILTGSHVSRVRMFAKWMVNTTSSQTIAISVL